jgi:hypothetical protein
MTATGRRQSFAGSSSAIAADGICESIVLQFSEGIAIEERQNLAGTSPTAAADSAGRPASSGWHILAVFERQNLAGHSPDAAADSTGEPAANERHGIAVREQDDLVGRLRRDRDKCSWRCQRPIGGLVDRRGQSRSGRGRRGRRHLDRGRVRAAAPRCRVGEHGVPPNPWDGGQFCLPRGAPGAAARGASIAASLEGIGGLVITLDGIAEPAKTGIVGLLPGVSVNDASEIAEIDRARPLSRH